MLHQEKTRRGERGFTFIEVLVAITVLAIVAFPVAALFTSVYAGMARSGRRTAALNLCCEKIESIKAEGYSCCLDCIGGNPEDSFSAAEEIADGSGIFMRETSLQLLDLPLEGEPSGAPLIAVRVQVSWREGEIERIVELESYLAGR